MTHNHDHPRVPVLLIRTGRVEMTAVSAGPPATGWHRLVGTVAAEVASALTAGTGGTGSSETAARTFTMRAQDLPAWDRLNRHGPGDYSYGTLWGGDGKIVTNVAIREASGSPIGVQRLPIDVLAFATAVVVAQMQASNERLTALIQQMGEDVQSILTFLQLGQEAELLAAIETIDDLYRRYSEQLSMGTVDWQRIVSLEQVIKKQHRQLLGELEDVGRQMRFTNIASAKSALAVNPDRVQNLLTLEQFLLRAWARWTELMFAAKGTRGELTLADIEEERHVVDAGLRDARQTVEILHLADGKVADRRPLQMLFSNGLLWGRYDDGVTKRDALALRTKIRGIAEAYSEMPIDDAGVLQLMPAPTQDEGNGGGAQDHGTVTEVVTR